MLAYILSSSYIVVLLCLPELSVCSTSIQTPPSRLREQNSFNAEEAREKAFYRILRDIKFTLDYGGVPGIEEILWLEELLGESQSADLIHEGVTVLADLYLSQGIQGVIAHNPEKALEEYTALAQHKVPAGEHFLAHAYSSGSAYLNVSRDEKATIIMESNSALNGNMGAMMGMGFRYMFGFGVPQDCERSLLYYRDAADLSLFESDQSLTEKSILSLSLLDELSENTFEMRKKVSQENRKLREAIEKKSHDGDLSALYEMGKILLDGLYGSVQNATLAADYFVAAAEKDSFDAISELGLMYMKGNGVDVNTEAGINLLEYGAKENHPSSCAYLGYIVLHGLGTDVDVSRAQELFEIAAKGGNTMAIYHLGEFALAEGHYEKAKSYFTEASNMNHNTGTHRLAQMMENGLDGERSCSDAAQLYKKIAESSRVAFFQGSMRLLEEGYVNVALARFARGADEGIEEAQHNAAWILTHPSSRSTDNGICDPSSEEMGALMYSWAATQGSISANSELGRILSTSECNIVKDLPLAAAYLGRAAAGGHAGAILQLANLVEKGNANSGLGSAESEIFFFDQSRCS